MTRWLLDIWCFNSVFNSRDTDMLITWPWYVYTWHLISNTWYLTLVLDMLSLNTWSLTPETWHLTIDMLSLDTWHMLSPGTNIFDLILWHLTGYYYTWHLYYITYSWLSLSPWHDYYTATRHLVLLYSWTPVSPVLISSALLLLLIARSYRRLIEYAWCRDDEDVSQDHASIRRILNETKCHTEQSVTPHTWRGHLLNLWGPPLESVGLPPESILQRKYSSLLSVPPGVSVINILSAY